MDLEIYKQENMQKKDTSKLQEKEMSQDKAIDLLVEEEVSAENQNNFLQSTLGKTINSAMDIGIRAILPDFIENQIIDVKNAVLTKGFKEGVQTAIEAAIGLGKSALGIATGKFENLSQAHAAVKKGGLIDGISELIDNTINHAQKGGKISNSTSRAIRKGKNAILSSISANIEENFFEQMNSMEKVSKYIENWKGYYAQKDMPGMEKEYQKLKQQLATVMALDATITEAKKIENVHNLLKNKGKDYVLSEDEQKLISVLI